MPQSPGRHMPVPFGEDFTFVLRLGLYVLLAAFLVAPGAAAGEEDLYAQVLRRYEAVNAELQRALIDVGGQAEIPDYPIRMLSLRKNAEVRVGGELRTGWTGATSSFRDPDIGAVDGGRRNDAKTGDLAIDTARLTIDARAGRRWRGFFDINLTGFPGRRPITRLTNVTAPGAAVPAYDRHKPTDIINEGYIELLKDGHSGFGFKAGIMKLPFGLAATPDLMPQSFMDAPDLTGSYLMHPASWDNAVRLPHASALLTPAAAVMLSYELRDIIRFEAGVFQERDTRVYHDYQANGVHRRRSQSIVPQSWQAGLNLLPLEGWELSMQFRNRHNRARGVHYWADSPYRWDFARNLASGKTDPSWDPSLGQWSDAGTGHSFGSRSNEQSFMLGIAMAIPNSNWSFFAEYAKGWNQGFNKHVRSEGVNLGLSYRLTPFLTLHAQGEWLMVKDGSWIVRDAAGNWSRDNRGNRLYRTLLGLEYELVRGLTLEAGWQYEYWNLTSNEGGSGGRRDSRTATANMVYVGSRFIF